MQARQAKKKKKITTGIAVLFLEKNSLPDVVWVNSGKSGVRVCACRNIFKKLQVVFLVMSKDLVYHLYRFI